MTMLNDEILCYLAEPVDFGSVPGELVQETEGQLAAMGWTTYRPKTAFAAGSKRPNGTISRINKAAMETARVAVAFLPSDVRTVGVPAEIGFFQARNTPVLLITDLGCDSWVVAGWADDTETNIEVVPPDTASVTAGLDWLQDRARLLAELEEFGQQAAGIEPVVFEKHVPTATLPTKGYTDDAGFDLYAAVDAVIPARGQAMVSCGVAVDIPEGMWAQITGRSSTLKKHNLLVAPTVGVIDEGYTGELFAPVVSISDEDVLVSKGDRIAQLILHHAPGQNFRPVWGRVRNKERGSNGFGSTGQ